MPVDVAAQADLRAKYSRLLGDRDTPAACPRGGTLMRGRADVPLSGSATGSFAVICWARLPANPP
jgi:hypothetical protein